jgi:deazaflavin-dependent oxidoreductase (nitroreductase family)
MVKNVANPLMRLSGAFPILSVRGRRTGKVYSTPVNLVDLGGASYVVSPRGETGWSRNLRANPECQIKVKGQVRTMRASEVDPAERAPIIAAYLEKYGGQTRREFEKLPDPVDHPTFRLDPA